MRFDIVSLFSYLVGHDVSQKHNVPRINAHTVAGHCELNFVDDSSPSSLNAQNLCSLDDMVGRSMFPNDS